MKDLRARIADNPWAAVGIAAGIGAFIGFAPLSGRGDRTEHSPARRWVADALLSVVGAIAMRFARETAFNQLGDMAKQWWEDHQAKSEVGANGKADAGGNHRRSDRGQA